MKPSQYLEESYEEYYYDNFLSKLVKEYNFKMPDRSEYLNKIHNPTPEVFTSSKKILLWM